LGKYRVPFAKRKQLTGGCLDFLEKCLECDPKARVSIDELDNHFWLDEGYSFIRESETLEESEHFFVA
jgi:serine/threonine protein kinase